MEIMGGEKEKREAKEKGDEEEEGEEEKNERVGSEG